MTSHKGKPSGGNKPEGTGIPSNMDNKDLKRDQQITGEYTQDDKTVKEKHPNRNENKTDSTKAGGYKH